MPQLITFISFELAKKLKEMFTNLVGNMTGTARREIPGCIKLGKEALISTNIFKNEDSGKTLIVY